MSVSTPTRRPFHGSCHCGFIKYIVFLTLPHKPPSIGTPPPTDPSRSHQEFYRCNCTTCHKAGHFHMRMAWAPEDFMLLSPLDPMAELGDYTCNSGLVHWLFCKTCGGRCFVFEGEWETAEVDLDEMGVKDRDGGKMGKRTIWRPKADGWSEQRECGCYLSVNGYTVDAAQEGFELGEFITNRWVAYVDCLELNGPEREPRYDKPYNGGAF
ncbi:uncharacterized protein TRIVIDRAFT_231478 [Trichoderma virens Gv29-8]|uniref:CENP-V/GFA domain-containing protein n=1 Tax=Hypocrea virens (strain Gv29-8 / FGSC 10586) TaxID=413071 RepID=G9N2E5_HYPVG|nr:uncharacterized protein TRIVIDRAFT_231478 [Trichoderma virens Gv29-8]EHK19256.1 hypothetical protein TRIVIDRAFT_231478 [Trichoderma virens Gv29-8]UKZ49288.1 hypothetical protein TrVGV298_003533 [Trichoderma virens]